MKLVRFQRVTAHPGVKKTDFVALNPRHIVSIFPHTNNPKGCNIQTVTGVVYDVRLPLWKVVEAVNKELASD